MIVPTSPRFLPGELGTPSGVIKLNGFLQNIEQVLNNLDFVNNFRGKFNTLVVQNGKTTLVPVQASFINVLKTTPNGAWTDVNITTAPTQGGFNITVSWTGSATQASIDVFAGVA